MRWAARLGRRVAVSGGAGLGAFAGAVFGLYLGVSVGILAWGIAGLSGGGSVVFDIGVVLGLLCVLGGAVLGARLFLRFRASANRLRLRHRRAGAFTWVVGSVLLALLAAFTAVGVYVFFHDLGAPPLPG